MLHSLLPKAHHRFLSLPVLGPITDGFDDWLAASGFTRGSRKFSIRMLLPLDANLRRRRVDEVAELNHAVLHDCWKALMKVYPCGAGTVHTLERYLVTSGLILDGRQPTAQPSVLNKEYTNPSPEGPRIRCLHRCQSSADGAMFSPASGDSRYCHKAPPRRGYRILYCQGRQAREPGNSSA
jgi:hypothetical protein